MELVKRSLSKWINAAIVLTLGILIIIMGAAKDKAAGDSANAISMVLGIVSIIIGSLALVLAIVTGIVAKKSFASAALSAGVTLALGISLVVGKYAAGLIALFLYIIPFMLIVLGAVIVADGVYTLVLAISKKCSVFAEVIDIIVGLTAVVLGCLCVGNNPVIPQNAQLITFGIIVVICACLIFLGTLVKLPTATVIVVEKE